MRNGLSIYDTHAHLGEARHSGRSFDADQMLRVMDWHGADRALLIPFPVVENHRMEHDRIAAAVRGHPDRFAGAACVYPFLPEQVFMDEVRRCAEELGFRALKLQPQYQALNPVSARSDFFFETARLHNLPVVCHTGTGVPYALPSLFIMPARKFPEVRLILGHAGGGVFAAEAIVAATVCPNIYIEMSSLMPHHILEILNHVGPDRLMIGSDLPENMEAEFGKIESLDVPEKVKKDIFWNTAKRVFDGWAP